MATREKKYPRREKVHLIFWFDESGKKKHKWIDDPGGIGWEIVREVTACSTCAASVSTPADASPANG